MPARNTNRGRGGGQGRDGNRQSGAGSRQGSSGAKSASARGSAGRGAATRAGAGASSGRAGGRSASSATLPSRSAGRSATGSTRTESGARSGAASGDSVSGGSRARKVAVTTGIAGGDLQSGGIAAAPSPEPVAPAADVDAGLFGSGASAGRATTSAARPSELEREIEQTRETSAATAAAAARPTEELRRGGVAGRGRPSSGLASWLAGAENPLAMMRRMQDDLDRVFRAFGIPRLGAVLAAPRELDELLSASPALTQSGQWSPQIEVFERGGNLVVHADLPAVRREDVQVEVDDDVLTIRGERRHEHRDTQGGYRRTERSYGTFFRQIPLPEGVDPSDIEAAYQDGVLEVIIPTPRDSQRIRRRVDIR